MSCGEFQIRSTKEFPTFSQKSPDRRARMVIDSADVLT